MLTSRKQEREMIKAPRLNTKQKSIQKKKEKKAQQCPSQIEKLPQRSIQQQGERVNHRPGFENKKKKMQKRTRKATIVLSSATREGWE